MACHDQATPNNTDITNDSAIQLFKSTPNAQGNEGMD